MKITAGIQQQLFNNPTHRAAHSKEEANVNMQHLLDEFTGTGDIENIEKEAKVLSLGEKNTLHALFGTEKPTEYSVYGNTKLQNIHKGQLIDLRA
ncbi:MAG: hypothetical protein KAI81_02185 [Candidatus Marinimicrobia bacterium]|nr:hypothetical protein [Candidatus Neomarinimicrobiota bacterium]